MRSNYDLVLVGTGFASSFFLHRFLSRSGSEVRVVVLERGEPKTHQWLLNRGHDELRIQSEQSFDNHSPEKPWRFMTSFGGSSNCWVGNTPRMLPNDFQLGSLYGVGADWPVSYDDLEEYYCDAEEMMSVAGPSDDSPFPRSRPYSQAPHRFSDVDKILKEGSPTTFFHAPSARPTAATNQRAGCCNNGVCTLCPIDSKFTIPNEMGHLYEDPRVTVIFGATVQQVEIQGGRHATGVVYSKEGRMNTARGDLVALGANALFNAHILLGSGVEHSELGRGLSEQVSKAVVVHLDGVDNFQGSTYVTGHSYLLYDGLHRRDRAAALIETSNVPNLRNERGKWRQILRLRVIYEDLRQPANYVGLNADQPLRPSTWFSDGRSAYSHRGMAELESEIVRLLAPLPVEKIMVSERITSTESHIQCTTPMGLDPRTSIVDKHLIHHSVRNLVVLGSGAFPSAGPANPTLTLSALSLWSADHLTNKLRVV